MSAPEAVSGAIPWLQLLAAGATLFLTAGCAGLMDRIAGASSRDPRTIGAEMSPRAKAMVAAAYDGIDPARIADYHVHIVGMGECGPDGQPSGCYVNPKMTTWLHPVERLKFEAYRSANQIADIEHAESEALARLLALARTAKGRFLILAFDEHRDPQGRVVPEKTEFHVPNDYALRVARENSDVLTAAASIHPLRPDAIAELERCRAAGVRIVKWLPNAMGMDPSDPRHAPFYDKMRELGMALLSHGGEEKAVEAEEDQRLGNPLLLRAPLARGVKVIVAHCASLGTDEDLDAPPGPDGTRPRVPAWRLFLRMMDDPRWDGLLFGDISAMTQSNRVPEPLQAILERPDLHRRLVNGSDWPLPAVNVVIRLAPLVESGLLDDADRDALREIYDFHPLMFDFVLKRRLRWTDASGVEHRLSPCVFEENPAIPLR